MNIYLNQETQFQKERKIIFKIRINIFENTLGKKDTWYKHLVKVYKYIPRVSYLKSSFARLFFSVPTSFQ